MKQKDGTICQETEMSISQLKEEIERLSIENELLQTKWLEPYVNARSYSTDLRKNIEAMEEAQRDAMMDFYFCYYIKEMPEAFGTEDFDEIPFDDPVFLDWFLPQILAAEVVEDVLSLVAAESFALFQKALQEKQEVTYTPFQGVEILVEVGYLFLIQEKEGYAIFASEDLKTAMAQIDLTALAVKQGKNVNSLSLAEAAVKLYGAISFEDLFQIHQQYQLDYVSSTKELEEFLNKVEENSQTISVIRRGILSDASFDDTLDELVQLLEEQEGKPRYVPETLVEFLKELEDHPNTNEKDQVISYLTKINDDEMELEDVMFFLEFGMQVDDPMEQILSHLMDSDFFPERKKEQSVLLDLLIEMDYHSRKWAHNGFSPSELDQTGIFSIGKKKKTQKFTQTEGTSKNGPCPCGSGKKFKRCCEGK